MVEPQDNRSTPTLLTSFRMIISDVLENIGIGPHATRIYNISDKPIHLIPFSLPVGGDDPASPRLTMLITGKETTIEAHRAELFFHSWDNRSERNTDCQIRILFRAGKNNKDNLKKVLADFRKSPKPEEGDRLFFPKDLHAKRRLYLKYEGGKVIEDENAGQDGMQTSDSLVTETQEGSALANLTDKVERLTSEVAGLKNDMEMLKKALASANSLIKCCDTLQANLDPSFSTNTPSSSK